MNRRLVLGFLGLAAVSAVLAALWWLRGREGAEAPAAPGPGELRATSRWSEGPPAPLPSLSLQINRSHELELEQGTALILTVRAANPRARNYASEQRGGVPDSDEGTAPGDEPPQKPAGQSGVGKLTLGTPQQGWDRLLRFHVRDQAGSLRPVQWPIRLARVEPAVAQLEASSVAEAVFVLSPQDAVSIAPGRYELVARLDVAESGSSGGWRGAVESEPVIVTIAAAAGAAGSARQGMLLANARYFLEVKDAAQAARLATEAAAADPQSVEAWIAVGDAKLAAGDKAGALAGYDRALDEQGKRPSAHEAPVALLWQIKRVGQQP